MDVSRLDDNLLEKADALFITKDAVKKRFQLFGSLSRKLTQVDVSQCQEQAQIVRMREDERLEVTFLWH